MTDHAKRIAEKASFQAFMNSYLRETDMGVWCCVDQWRRHHQLQEGAQMIELHLPHQALRYGLEVTYASTAVGRHQFGRVFAYRPHTKKWEQTDYFTVMIHAIQELHFKEKGTHYDELLVRLLDSCHTMTGYIEKRLGDADRLYDPRQTFIESEQSLLFGHWLHPTPKSRQGMASWQHDRFAPELKGSFQLHYFEVHNSLIEEDSLLHKKTSELLMESVRHALPEMKAAEGCSLIPMHPLQAEWLLQQDDVKAFIQQGTLKSLGTFGTAYTATSSFRTLYAPEEDWMLKFSIPVKLTNSLRVNKRHELKAGMTMAKLMRRLPFLTAYPDFHMIEDPAYLTLNLPSTKESGFEMIIRFNPFSAAEGSGRGICSIASLTQDPVPGEHSKLSRVITQLADTAQASAESVSLKWFERYWYQAIEPLIHLYDEYGIALEAHQQNSLIDLSTGYPSAYYYRDNQGYYLAESEKQQLLEIERDLARAPELFYTESLIEDRFTYYAFMNQLASVIYRFGADGLISESELIDWVTERFETLEKGLSNRGKRFVSRLLKAEKLPCKANLLTRLHDVDELEEALEQAVYTYVKNPFAKEGKGHAYADVSISV
ncbi:IucA/IucC family protein [Jeotgalibacillus haloalkalitolerans]|uniref:IucA/IucC family protein n=1 Tax=Jeotgalibacillus haloalkalitolerans TaxID=3104292 RepID=A0ABU5KHM6_9BACL|nr:IucA/IucC family protein [Jeotgalibacillus sp. HH7-29]MDZ5710723.1 IucA/IucC family protein [Jeotgalibacillus sp. HH7-29]